MPELILNNGMLCAAGFAPFSSLVTITDNVALP